MVLTSISQISFSSSSWFRSISNFTTHYSLPSTSIPFTTRTTLPLLPFPIRTTPFSSQNAIFTPHNGFPEQFLSNNSITDFMRFKGCGDGASGDLQTALVSYKKKFPSSLFNPLLQVDLVSTIHIADEEYFLALQKELESYDCVLYEMVASRFKGSRSRSFNILGCIQRQMARTLGLGFQLDCLNYQAANWYHADLDFETFKLLQQEKGESFFSFARDMTLRSKKVTLQPSIPEDLDPLRLKLIWASRVLPMPLVGHLIIGCVCADMRSQASEYPEIKALSRLDFGGAMKIFLAKRLTSDVVKVHSGESRSGGEICNNRGEK